MGELSAGKARGLTALANDAGVFTILAVDHRDSMRVVLDAAAPARVPADRLTEVKLLLLRHLADLASGVLLDPEYSALQAVGTRALPSGTGFICALEAQGYLGGPEARITTLLEGWGVAKAKRMGASGVKLLLPYRPDTPAAEVQDGLVAAVVADCEEAEVPLFLEPIAYASEGTAPPGTAEFAGERRRIVCDSARRLGALGPDVLKLQFPLDTAHDTDPAAWRDACLELTEAAVVPWALLSGGDPYEAFREQVRAACAAGASGFLVGRALWNDAVAADDDRRAVILDTEVRPRLAELGTIATELGTDWAARHSLPNFGEGDYRTY